MYPCVWGDRWGVIPISPAFILYLMGTVFGLPLLYLMNNKIGPIGAWSNQGWVRLTLLLHTLHVFRHMGSSGGEGDEEYVCRYHPTIFRSQVVVFNKKRLQSLLKFFKIFIDIVVLKLFKESTAPMHSRFKY